MTVRFLVGASERIEYSFGEQILEAGAGKSKFQFGASLYSFDMLFDIQIKMLNK